MEFGIIFLFILFAVGMHMVAGSMDGERVEAYIRERGWKLVNKSWDPFGPGWFGEKESRIYQVTHFDLANNYGPPPGSAQERMGRIHRENFGGLRN